LLNGIPQPVVTTCLAFITYNYGIVNIEPTTYPLHLLPYCLTALQLRRTPLLDVKLGRAQQERITQGLLINNFPSQPANLKNQSRTYTYALDATHLEPVLLVDLLVILARQHVAEMPDGWIMHNGNFIPPLVLSLIVLSARVVLLR
jgi:hypothetical protein